MDSLDVRGLSCPIPVLKTKKALEKGSTELEIVGSSKVSQENVSKFAASQGYKVEVAEDKSDEWKIVITK